MWIKGYLLPGLLLLVVVLFILACVLMDMFPGLNHWAQSHLMISDLLNFAAAFSMAGLVE